MITTVVTVETIKYLWRIKKFNTLTEQFCHSICQTQKSKIFYKGKHFQNRQKIQIKIKIGKKNNKKSLGATKLSLK